MATLRDLANILMVQFNHFFISLPKMWPILLEETQIYMRPERMTKHRFGFKLTNWWEKQSAYNSPYDYRTAPHVVKEEKEYSSGMSRLTELACNKLDTVELLVTQDRSSDLFTITCLKVSCFYQDSTCLPKLLVYIYHFELMKSFRFKSCNDFTSWL